MKVKKPHRATRTFAQTIEATPAEVFPLYCPVREVDWVPGWALPLVISESGIAEPDCVFTTDEEVGESLWYVTVHDRDGGRVEMLKHTPGVVVSKLQIGLEPLDGDRTTATITYCLTSLSAEGDRKVDAFTEAFYGDFMRAWAAQMNHYLRTGGQLGTGD